jgi:hypothetical protein
LGDKHLVAAIGRVKSQSTADIRKVLENAKRKGIADLIAACEQELQLRGSLKLTEVEAKDAVRIEEEMERKTLTEVIADAFNWRPVDELEVRLLHVISKMPGASFREIEKAFGRRDTALVAGHWFITGSAFSDGLFRWHDQSSLLIDKTESNEGIRWQLRSEAHAIFSGLGYL